MILLLCFMTYNNSLRWTWIVLLLILKTWTICGRHRRFDLSYVLLRERHLFWLQLRRECSAMCSSSSIQRTFSNLLAWKKNSGGLIYSLAFCKNFKVRFTRENIMFALNMTWHIIFNQREALSSRTVDVASERCYSCVGERGKADTHTNLCNCECSPPLENMWGGILL